MKILSVSSRHFADFVVMFPLPVLEEDILPQLLLGMKDTSDDLVAATLKALADLVPILGAKTVVGRNRRKIFADGRPNEVKLRALSLIDSLFSKLSLSNFYSIQVIGRTRLIHSAVTSP